MQGQSYTNPVVNWASTDTLTLPAGMQLLSLSFLECWDVGMQNMENYQASSKLSPPVKTGQSWGCVIYKNSRRVVYILVPREECCALQPRFPVLLLVARNGVQGPFVTHVPNPLCVSTQPAAQEFTAFPWRGPGGQVHDQPPRYTVCWLSCIMQT